MSIFLWVAISHLDKTALTGFNRVFFFFKKKEDIPVIHTFNPSTFGAEANKSQSCGQPGLQSEF